LPGDLRHHRRSGELPDGSQINPMAVHVLAERGISLTEAYPKPLSNDIIHAADVIVTMGCGDACPIYAGKRYLHWDVSDPQRSAHRLGSRHSRRPPARITALLRDLKI